MENINFRKADRCIIEESSINFYDVIMNHKSLGGNPFTFDGHTLPVNTVDLLIRDDTLNISIVASYNGGNEYIKIIGLELNDILIYDDGTWNSELTYTLPNNFIYDITSDIEEQKELIESIMLNIPEHEETICSLSSHIYGGTGLNQGFDNLWIDAINGDDNNDGYTKSSAFKTLDKTLEVLNNTSTGDHIINVNIAPGNYNYTSTDINSMDKVYFTGDKYGGGEIIINVTEPIIFKSSNYLSFKELRIINNGNASKYEGLCLVLYDCENFELFHCNLYHTGDSTTLDNVGLLSLLNSNGTVQEVEFSYTNTQTGPLSGAGGVRVANNGYFSWNNWDVTCNNLQWLCLNKEGYFFTHRDVPTNNDAVPYSCENTIGYYRCITKCPSSSGEPRSFYDAIKDDTNFSSAILTFDGTTLPANVAGGVTEVKDVLHNTGIYANNLADWMEPQTAYIDLYRLSSDYPVYIRGEWTSNLTQVLPVGTNFVGASLTNFEEQKDFWESIQVTLPSELTVCEKFQEVDGKLNRAVYSEDGTVKDVSYGPEPTEAESLAHPKRLYLWNDDD
jgi:hypothetical protein